MSKGFGTNVDTGKGIAFDLNLATDNDDVVLDCSICVEPLGIKGNDRTVVTLCCQHEFHLDCIGSAFNAKHNMQCPYCRNVEKGQWLHASGPPTHAPLYHDPFVFPSCPRQFDRNGIATNPWLSSYGPNQFLHDGYTSFDELRSDINSENTMLLHRVEQNLAFLAANDPYLQRFRGSYDGGESSRSVGRGGGNSNNGRSG